MEQNILKTGLAKVVAEICENLYAKGGMSAVTDYANKIELSYAFCVPCDTSTPMIQTINSCDCAICGTPNPHSEIVAIIERKRNGIDCTEIESAEIKGWLRETTLSVHDNTTDIERDLQTYFPLEYGEYLDEQGDYDADNNRIINGLLSDIPSYEDYLKVMINFYLEQKPEEKQYWLDWVNGNDMTKYN